MSEITFPKTTTFLPLSGFASEDEDRLIVDKFKNYNSLIRPVEHVNSSPVVVNFGLAMILLINIVSMLYA